jgi:hypothetical protein
MPRRRGLLRPLLRCLPSSKLREQRVARQRPLQPPRQPPRQTPRHPLRAPARQRPLLLPRQRPRWHHRQLPLLFPRLRPLQHREKVRQTTLANQPPPTPAAPRARRLILPLRLSSQLQQHRSLPRKTQRRRGLLQPLRRCLPSSKLHEREARQPPRQRPLKITRQRHLQHTLRHRRQRPQQHHLRRP